MKPEGGVDKLQILRLLSKRKKMQTENFRLHIGLVGAWFGTAITCLIFSLTLMFYISTTKVVNPVSQNFNLYAALPENNSEVSEEIASQDGRAKIIENFFRRNKSPLANYSETFVSVADKYNLDYKLLPSISMQESNGGKRVIEDSYNPFGYGIYGKMKLKFPSWEEAIERVGRALREDYLNQGLTTPEKIMAKYTPPSLEKGGTWAKGVSTFMEELR